MFQAKFVQKIKTHILCSVILSLKSCHLRDNVETKYCTARQGTYNTAHELCTLDTQGYRHTLRLRNTSCCSTVTMVTLTLTNVTLYVKCVLVYSNRHVPLWSLAKDHHHHISVMESGHLLTRSGLTYPEVSSKVCHDSFCQLGNSVSLPWVYSLLYNGYRVYPGVKSGRGVTLTPSPPSSAVVMEE